MSKRRLVWFLLIGLMFLSGCGADQPEPPKPGVAANPSMVSRAELNNVLATEPQERVELNGRAVSGVLPHHLLAAPLLTNYLNSLSVQQPQLIILVGPNHDNEGARIITGLNDWQTPEGRMQTDEQAVNQLLKQGLAVRNEQVMAGEHSIAGLVPLIRHYWPGARIAPIILHHDVSLAEVDRLLAGLQPFLDQDTLLLASVDFSHYLTRSQAEEKDQITLQHMQNFDYATLFRLDNDYMDSPASLAVALRWAESQGIKTFQVVDHTNSGVILRNDMIETTSYFTLVFTR